MTRVDNNYINEAIEYLMNLLGVRENIDSKYLVTCIKRGKIKKCITMIANYFGLSLNINLRYVSDDYDSKENSEQSSQFESKDLTETDSAGKGMTAITAQVSIPPYVPLFGTSSLNNFPINVKINKNIKNHPDVFIAIMAHEISHILLRSLMSSKKDDEIYTDLTAMVAGYNDVMQRGRTMEKVEYQPSKTITRTTKYGYLDDKQFYFAYHKINTILQNHINTKERLFDKNIYLTRKILTLKKNLFKFENYFLWIDNHCNSKKIKIRDVNEIMSFHAPNYIGNFKKFVEVSEYKILFNNSFLRSINNYKKDWSLEIERKIAALELIVKKNDKTVMDNLKVLRRNVSVFRRFIYVKNKTRKSK